MCTIQKSGEPKGELQSVSLGIYTSKVWQKSAAICLGGVATENLSFDRGSLEGRLAKISTLRLVTISQTLLNLE